MPSNTGEPESCIAIKVTDAEPGSDQFEHADDFLTFPEFVSAFTAIVEGLENTNFYKNHGYVWFYLNSTGLKTQGYFKLNPAGKTIEEMFIPVSTNEYSRLPYRERAYFLPGEQRMRIYLGHDPRACRARIVVGHNKPQYPAPAVVVKQHV